jgi:hypothetical protein
VAALVIWRLSLRHVDVTHLDSYGLPPALGLAWFAALGLALIGASLTLGAGRFRPLVFVLYLIAVATILYGSIAVLSAQPHYSWAYKHFGVTRLLEAQGHVSTGVDIYNRWPGFFALAAVFARVAGQSNPEAYASWAELFFTLIDAALIAGVVKAIARSGQIAAAAALLFVVSDWVGQEYFSPQAFGFTLGLGLLLVVLRHLCPTDRLSARRLTRMIGRVARTAQLPALGDRSSTWPRRTSIGVVLALDVVIVGSHQLTPYMVLVQMVVLMLTGLLKTRGMVAVMALITFAYLAANLSYVQHNFGLFSSIDPFNNAQHSAIYDLAPQAGKAFSAQAAHLLSFVVWLGAALAAAVLARRGLLRRALPLALLAVSPFALIFGQSYGGEASLRVILFSFPWCAALIAWALLAIRRVRLRQCLTVAGALVLSALFVPAFLGQEELNVIPVGEVRASDWFYAHAPADSVLMLAGPDFPARYGPRYKVVIGPQSDDDPNLLRTPTFRHRPLGPADVPSVLGGIRDYSSRGFLAFSTTEDTYARVFRLTAPGGLESLERAVAASPQFRLVYGDRDARIYEVLRRTR